MSYPPEYIEKRKAWELKTGGCAFPSHKDATDGMALRDHFAAKAMAAQISIEGMEGCDKETIAGMAYELADAMLKERSK